MKNVERGTVLGNGATVIDFVSKSYIDSKSYVFCQLGDQFVSWIIDENGKCNTGMYYGKKGLESAYKEFKIRTGYVSRNTDQDICTKFVNLHIHADITAFVTTMLNAWQSGLLSNLPVPFDYDCFSNNNERPCGECDSCNEDLDCDYPEYPEPLHYMLVSEFLYRKLKDKGEYVIDSDSGYIWGRLNSGQSTILDCVIVEICSDMGILRDQEYSWEYRQ